MTPNFFVGNAASTKYSEFARQWTIGCHAIDKKIQWRDSVNQSI
ncbi:hypothetical protein CAter282_0836 [Collimonas arenae]|uniref:Uncharacterized protein n=1 Tax=Collimonas arenae TaxID=279058 RepID=A0A127PLV5_9BURK|nr:hypothetical protein CAter10_0909 [Collimonas arenae]AMP08638.1 hypothetical protein CAter282_0836 [Collimonas arenae]